MGIAGGKGFRTAVLETDRGRLEARYYPLPDGALVVLWVGGVVGGFDTPARGLYPRLAANLTADLTADGIASSRFHDPQDLDQAVYECGAG
ncbi:hypothetical protein [Azospirillum humicireducens]|uniref:hypothetical protein n=1 Tax=Azospirillum humicireducens TaxID=1226968 RepID=UPI0007C0F067|nr:hypothetical protein [Azospirillum humicireducens]